MKVTSKKAKELLGKINTTPQGKSFELPPLLPAFSDAPVQATVADHWDNTWCLACYWEGVSIGDLHVTVVNGEVELEVI